jgi:hypothetical protein
MIVNTKIDSVYVVLLMDRHTGPQVEIFSDKDKAINHAKDIVRGYGYGELIDEELAKEMQKEGWLYYNCYSCEGDYVVVMEQEIND